jgi:hypothetical protein
MARHYGVFPSTISYHIDKGRLPHPNTLNPDIPIAQALKDTPYPQTSNQRRGPGIRGGQKALRVYGADHKHIVSGPGGITKIAAHLNITTKQVIEQIQKGKIPDPNKQAVNLNKIQRAKTQVTEEHVRQAISEAQPNPWFDKEPKSNGLIQRLAYLEDKIDIIIRYLLNLNNTIGG